MIDVAGWPAKTDAVEPAFKVLHGGVDRQVTTVSVKRELPSSFARQVVGLGGMTAADGRIDWAESDDVAVQLPHPSNRVNSWPPKTGDKVEISLGYKDALAKVLTGVVKNVSGSPFDHPSSSVMDHLGRLNKTISVPPLLNLMPPVEDGGNYRWIGLYPTYFTDMLLRQGGYCTTPPMSSGCVASIPAMGSLWPERGTIIFAENYDRTAGTPSWEATPWTIGVSNLWARIVPSGNSVLDRPMEVTGMFEVGSGQSAGVSVDWAGAELRLHVGSTAAQAQLVNNSGTTVIASLAKTGSVFTMRVVPNGTTLTCTVRDSAGNEASGTVAKPAESVNNADHVIIYSTVAGSNVGGVQVAFPSTAWTAVNYTRKAYLTLAAHSAHFTASPAIDNKNVLDLLNEQSRAELAAMWIDHNDNFHWINCNALLGAAPVGTLTSKDHLLDMPWLEDISGVASSVEVSYRQATLQRSKSPRFEVWQSSYSQVEADGTEHFEEVIHPDTDQDWVMVDTSVNNPADTAAFSKMIGTAIGVYYFLENGTPGEAGYTSAEGFDKDWAGTTIQRIDHRSYKVVTDVHQVSTAGWEEHEFSLKIPTEKQSASGGGWGYNLGGLQFPVIRAFAVTSWADMMQTAPGSNSDAPSLQHDAGWWVQSDAGAQTLADFLSAQVASPQVVLDAIPIVPDSRIEPGDIYWLNDPDVSGLTFKALVTGINQTMGGNPVAWDMDINVQVLSATTT